MKISLNQPTGAISSVLSDIIQPESYEFELLIYGCSHSDAASITSQLQYVIENIIYEVSGIMVNEFLSLPLFLSSPFFFPFSLSFSLVPFLPLFEFLALFLVGVWQFSHVYSQFWQFSHYISPLSFFYLTQNFCLQPTQGLLGTNFKSSGIYELIREGNTFPDGYFLQCEIVSIFYSQHMYSCYLILPL